MNFKSSSWDTCAPEALVRAAGGELAAAQSLPMTIMTFITMANLHSLGNFTDLFGERIVYRSEPLADDTSGHLNACGVVASSAAFAQTHRTVCEAMRGNAEAAGRLQPCGLADPAVTASSRAEVDRVLCARRSRLLGGIGDSDDADEATPQGTIPAV